MYGGVCNGRKRRMVDGGWKDGRNVESIPCWEPDMEMGRKDGLKLFKKNEPTALHRYLPHTQQNQQARSLALCGCCVT
jgi:hypothetical protein